MDWSFLTGPALHPQSQVLYGCSLEAERADIVAQGLDGLRAALNHQFHGHMIAVTEEIRQSSTLLRDLAARSQAHRSRIPIVAEHLSVLLPCMSKTLRDITAHYEDKTVSRENRWRKMYHDMLREADGLPLPQRFLLYNLFLAHLLYFLTRDNQRFDPALLQQLRTKILALRRKRDIADPPQPLATPAAVIVAAPAADQLIQQRPASATAATGAVAIAMPVAVSREHLRPHWCERVFALPPVSMIDTGLEERMEIGVPMVSGLDPRRPRGRVLMRQSYDSGQFCAKFILAGRQEEPFVVLRVYMDGGARVAWQPHSGLVAARDGCNAVVLKRCSQSGRVLEEWVRLSFVHWEEVVLFYTAFVVLKARNPLGQGVVSTEYELANENTLFRANIIDDGYKHALMVTQDQYTAGVRLLAAVSDGELEKCPVWTAFVPSHLLQSRRWLVRDSKHRVLVKGIELYVFCQKYRESSMRRNSSGSFEILFIKEQGATRFMELLRGFQQALEPPDEQAFIAGPS